jgi:hypothetical protein
MCVLSSYRCFSVQTVLWVEYISVILISLTQSSILESVGTSFARGRVRLNRMESSAIVFMSFDPLKSHN